MNLTKSTGKLHFLCSVCLTLLDNYCLKTLIKYQKYTSIKANFHEYQHSSACAIQKYCVYNVVKTKFAFMVRINKLQHQRGQLAFPIVQIHKQPFSGVEIVPQCKRKVYLNFRLLFCRNNRTF